MNTALPQNELENLLDDAVRKVTAETTGIELRRGGDPPTDNACTIHISFRKEFRSSLSLQADVGLLTHMAQEFIQLETVTPQDVEDFSKEYFNVLCGKIAAIFYKTTKKPARFSIPSFYWGLYEPEGQRRQFALTYSDDQHRSAQLIHHIPLEDPAGGASGMISA